MATDKETLLSFGFDPARIDWALKATGNRGLQPAMDYMLEHEGEAVPDPSAVSGSGAAAGVTSDVGAPMDQDDEDSEALKSLGVLANNEVEAKSIKCSECGKIFRNTALANFHAEKSGHDQFEESMEEIKPLTEEERKKKLAELRAKMSEKRSKKAEEEAKEHKVNESIRRKAGKDMVQIKEDLKLKQALKDAEEKKREKIADARAKAAIKAQIEADKIARAEKFAREKALRDGQPIPDNSTTPAPAPAASASAGSSTGVAGKDFKETRLQIRMASGGQPCTTTLSSDATLREVAEYLAGQALSVDIETVTFAQHFPRKTFSRSDFSRTLRDLGLTPSAVLIAS
jgi:hypothetical protein